MASIGHPDWRDGPAYAPLLEADRSILAWEWLRRDAGYRRAAQGGRSRGRGDAAGPEAWGLHCFEDPELAAPDARPIWRSELLANVLAAARMGRPALASDGFDASRIASLISSVPDRDGQEHLLISDGLRTIRLDFFGPDVGHGPVRLRYLISGIASAEGPLATLRQFLALVRTGRFSRNLHRPEPRARRWILALRAHDGLAAGAGQREIAAVLLSRSAAMARWRSEAPSIRSQVQRLVRSAGAMAAGGYLELFD